MKLELISSLSLALSLTEASGLLGSTRQEIDPNIYLMYMTNGVPALEANPPKCGLFVQTQVLVAGLNRVGSGDLWFPNPATRAWEVHRNTSRALSAIHEVGATNAGQEDQAVHYLQKLKILRLPATPIGTQLWCQRQATHFATLLWRNHWADIPKLVVAGGILGVAGAVSTSLGAAWGITELKARIRRRRRRANRAARQRDAPETHDPERVAPYHHAPETHEPEREALKHKAPETHEYGKLEEKIIELESHAQELEHQRPVNNLACERVLQELKGARQKAGN